MSSILYLIVIIFGSSSLSVESFSQQRLPYYHPMSPTATRLMNRFVTKQVIVQQQNIGWLLHSIQGIPLPSSQLFLSSNGPKSTCLNTMSSSSSSSNLVSGSTVDVTTPLPVFQSSTAISQTDHPNLQQQQSPTKKHFFHSKATVLSRPSSDASLEVKEKRQLIPKKYWEKAFSIDLPEGKCVGLRFIPLPPSDPNSMNAKQIRSNADHWLRQYLHPKEIEYGLEKLVSETTRNNFFLGRLAMRTALKELDREKTNTDDYHYDDLPKLSNLDDAILKDEYGRPTVPDNFLGSISHKITTGVALVSFSNSTSDIIQENKASARLGVGVDIEQTQSRRRSIAKKVLTENELSDLGKIEGVSKDEEVLLRFSLKESVYKAMHPLICQFVGFQEAEIKPLEDGTALVTLNLKSGAHNNFATVKAHWKRLDQDFFLTSSVVTMKK